MKIKATLDKTGIQKLLVNVPKQMRYRFLDAFEHIGLSFYKTFNERNLAGRPYVKAGEWPSIRQRFSFEILKGLTQKEFGVHIFFRRSKVVRRQEYGETLTASQFGSRIPVPLSARGAYLLNDRGRVKSSFSVVNRFVREAKGSSKQIRPIKGKDGQWYLAEINSRTRDPKKRVLPLFVLKDRVTVPARLKFFETYEEMTPKFRGYLKDALDKGVDG